MKYFTRLAVLIIGVSASAASIGTSYADTSPAFTPAHFNTGNKRSIDKVVLFPETDTDVSVLIRCAGMVGRSGRLTGHNCFVQNDFEVPFAQALEGAAWAARLVPATVNGKKKMVRLQYMARFERRGPDQRVRFYANWGVNFDRFGTGYFGVQPYDVPTWPKPCSGSENRFFVYTSVEVRSDGTGVGAELHGLEGNLAPQCGAALKEMALNSNYIPAYYNGKPADSLCVQPWWPDQRRKSAHESGAIKVLRFDGDAAY